MLELPQGNAYIYLQSPMVAVGSNISSQKPSLEECVDTFGEDSIKVIHHDELHDLIGVGSPSLPR
ncbi:hypothetical protein H6G97_42740 [Nostoc flagelliforme FACHB-838]|uniref:Uncharacterized protein n=1 Tax=Nostoc flagelliforme FACHB-838 TaxID=2692904 RepID=A0ABR8E3S4_9NOSO|nr:hypothetical protein [Nostoc flagelliforme]MBD2535722.1 hypothetical protein [Nostoc flagelliforme FACHB-838]